MRIFIPFTKLRSDTLLALPFATLVPLHRGNDSTSYAEYFRDRWSEKEPFINVEHDVVPPAQILESLWNCSNPICVTGYVYPDSPPEFQPEITYGGCIKISRQFILDHPDLWKDNLPTWSRCDGRITKAIEDNPYPGINGNDQHCYHGEVLHLHGC